MLEAALAGDRLIAMALLRDDWHGDYFGEPTIHSTVCLGRVISESRLENGCYNILLVGLTRAEVLRELPSDRPYRRAEIRLQPDQYRNQDSAAHQQLQRRLLTRFRQLFPSVATEDESVQQLLRDQVSLAMLSDVIAHTLQMPLSAKLALLECRIVEERAETLLRYLTALQEAGGQDASFPFPPPFSQN
jgi:Lon protease-like protein